MHLGKGIKAAAAIMLIIAAALFLKCGGNCLVLRNWETGKVIASYPMEEGGTFSVGFIHSVNKSPVTDIYEIHDGKIYVEKTVYYHFGAGVQTELNEGEILTYGDDGAMIVSNIHQDRSGVIYRVGTVSDHVLTLGTEEISLRNLCGKNTAVQFTYGYRLFK